MVLLALVVLGSACGTPYPALRTATVEHGKLGKLGDVWILELDGSPVERGKAEGALLGDQIRWLLPRYLKKVASVDKLSNYQKKMVAAIAAGIPREHSDQLNAVADAAQVDRTALFAVNLAPEVLSSFACSCLATTAERSVDQKVRLARNLDWPGGDLLAEAGLVVIESGTGHRFASFTWPGLVSVATGMNDAGLAVADLMALGAGPKHPQPGLPVLFALRGLLEHTDSVDAALASLQSTQRTMAQNYALADAHGARVVETSPSHFYVRSVETGLAAITNFWHEERGGAKDGRYARMVQSAGKDKLGAADLQRILAEAAIASMNVQYVILEPETRRATIAQGKTPVTKGSWKSLDLSPWLGKPTAP
jgi:Acyl-coenzyme A:6-aminopenicillanic acid acyl-transferase